MSERIYAVSMASLLPLSWGPGGLARSHKYASKRGMGIQALPFRGCTLFAPKKAGSTIVSLEGAWNEEAGDLKKALERLLIGNQHLPSLWDWVLFGPGHKDREFVLAGLKFAFPNVIHHVPIGEETSSAGLWLEVTSSLHKYAKGVSFLDWLLEKDYRLVVDTLYVRRPHKPWHRVPFDRGCLYAIRTLVKAGKVGMIHFQPDHSSGELDNFMAGEPTFLQPILWSLQEAGPVPVVIETHPLAGYDLANVRDRISEELDE